MSVNSFVFSTVCPNGITNITASKGVIAYPQSGTYGINETKCWRIEVPETYRGVYWTFTRQVIPCFLFLHVPFIEEKWGHPVYKGDFQGI